LTEVGLNKRDVDTPFLWTDLDKLDSNITQLATMFSDAGVQWRPHIKGIKVPAIAHKAIKAGAIGVTCAKLGEAEVMVDAGITDILIANQLVTPQKIARLVNLCRRADVKVAVDGKPNATQIAEAATAAGVEVGVIIEIDSGMSRAGVAPGEATVAMSQFVHGTPGLRYMGLMAWEGHTAAMTDFDHKRTLIEKSVSALTHSADLCRDSGLSVAIVSCGGTSTLSVTPFLPGITEIQAGGGMFNDRAYSGRQVDTEICAFVRCTVTSRPVPERMILDGGFKTIPAWPGEPIALGLDHVEGIKTSAEHMIINLSAPNTTVKVGDAFDFIVPYTDATTFLHDYLYGMRNDVVEAVWAVAARGKLR
jgi:D-serine deaminase-like pyridoxal phosphate-dependent protein